MDEIRSAKEQLRKDVIQVLNRMGEKQRAAKTAVIEAKLLDLANFQEARVVLLYAEGEHEVRTLPLLRKTLALGKILALPAFDPERKKTSFFKVDQPEKDLQPGPRGALEPRPERCKPVMPQKVDIAIIPGLAFDEKGGRLGSGWGGYDRLIPELPITTRKVALAFEEQIVSQVPMEHHDKPVDIIITDKRVIYKI